VRLKDFSIFAHADFFTLFQFLLVRLKAEIAEFANKSEKYFNSFWCD